jgi:hypothetical protein
LRYGHWQSEHLQFRSVPGNSRKDSLDGNDYGQGGQQLASSWISGSSRSFLPISTTLELLKISAHSFFRTFVRAGRARLVFIIVALATAFQLQTNGSENVPHRPFALWADLPLAGQLVLGAVYEQSDAYDIWVDGHHHSISSKSDLGEEGIHINQGFIALQYGLTERWALDFNIGGTAIGFPSSTGGETQSTSGVMDWSFGARCQVFNETNGTSPWVPTLTFRAGAVMPGSYDQLFPFAPGLRSAGIEPELLLRKHFGWTGFGSYGDALYRWNHTTGNDQYIIALGLFQQLQGVELDMGWRHLQTLSGSDIVLHPDGTISYPRDVRENSDAIEAGVCYTTSKRHLRYGGHVRVVLDGNNTDDKFWFGFSLDFPFAITTPPAKE